MHECQSLPSLGFIIIVLVVVENQPSPIPHPRASELRYTRVGAAIVALVVLELARDASPHLRLRFVFVHAVIPAVDGASAEAVVPAVPGRGCDMSVRTAR